jgi:SAM-dependent methyltransferase
MNELLTREAQPQSWQPRRPNRLVLRATDGDELPIDPSRWHGPTSPAEQEMLDRLRGPVLDVGCGPGRIVERLVRRGIIALGVDPAPGAVSLARRRGCPVLQRSVFEPLPGEGRWRSVLLLDGNVGIGGDPLRLLQRCRSLVHDRGDVVVEAQRPGTGMRTCRARLERASEHSAWFAWSVVAVDALPVVAGQAGLRLVGVESTDNDRWFAHLTVDRRPARGDS